MNFAKNNAFVTNLHFDQVRVAAAKAHDRDGQRGDNQAAATAESAQLLVVKAAGDKQNDNAKAKNPN